MKCKSSIPGIYRYLILCIYEKAKGSIFIKEVHGADEADAQQAFLAHYEEDRKKAIRSKLDLGPIVDVVVINGCLDDVVID